MAEPNPDVIQRLAERVEVQGPPLPADVAERERARVGPAFEDQGPPNPDVERRNREQDFMRAVDAGQIDLSDASVRARLDPEAREFVMRRVRENQQEQERQRVTAVLRRYWYGPDIIEKLSGSIKTDDGRGELPIEAVPQADVTAAAPTNAFAPLPKPIPRGGYR